jgi:TRAP-type C4-dicarboxylate transport system permease small subunit
MSVTFRRMVVLLISRAYYLVAGIALMAMMAIVVANIIGRIFFKWPILGTIEIAGLAGVVVMAVAVGLSESQHRNIVVDIITAQLPSRIRIVANCVAYLLSLIAVGFLLWAVAESAFESMSEGEITFVLGMPVSPFRFIWAGGLLILFFFLLHNFIVTLQRGVKK